MPDTTGSPRGAAPRRDWAGLVRARLAGSAPRHELAESLLPGLFEPGNRGREGSLAGRELTPAAVLIPLVERRELSVLFTQRATGLRNHAGQISFPGGRIEPQDGSPQAAALREAHEEIGLEERFVSIIGYLPDHLVVTGFRITPVVAFVQPGFELALDAVEVHDSFEVPLDYLFDPANQQLQRRHSLVAGQEVEVRAIQYGERTIWGATAGMLMTLYRVCVADE